VKKPGCTLVNLVNTSGLDLKALTKSDACIVWGGSNDVGWNETNLGIRALKHFISSHKHTNVIVISVPQRHYLSPNSVILVRTRTIPTERPPHVGKDFNANFCG
jgi:hypothetical protein